MRIHYLSQKNGSDQHFGCMDKSTIITSIVTSLIASCIFAIINVIPAIIKYLRIRPRVEDDLKDISVQLLFYIQIPFLQSIHTSTDYQKDICNNQLSKTDFENALYGKCLSSKRCVDGFEHRLLPVGEKLEIRTKEIDLRIDRIQRYAQYLSTKEILLLKDIGEKLHVYEYDDYEETINGIRFTSVNPTISYMSNNFYELYNLYHDLIALLDACLLIKRSEYEKYSLALKQLEKRKYLKFFWKRLFIHGKYAALLEIRWNYLIKDKKKTEKALRKYLMLEKSRLIYLRGYLEFIYSDAEYKAVFKEIRGDEVEEWYSCVDSENIRRHKFELRNVENKRIISEMIKNVPKLNELDDKTLKCVEMLFDGYK